MKPERPPAANYTFLADDGGSVLTLNRENFVIIESDGSLNTLYHDKDDTTRLYVTQHMDGERFAMVANRTTEGVPMQVVMALKDLMFPDQSLMMAGMQRGEDSVIGAIMVTLPGSYWKDGQLPTHQRN